MKTRWMIKVESKIKDAPRGAPFILLSRSLVPGTYWLKWSEVWWELWLEYAWTLHLILRVHFDISSSLQDSRRITRYSTTANKCKPSSTWMSDSLKLKHHSSEWLSSGFLLQSIYTNDFDIYERFQAHECLIHTNWWLSPGLLPWVTSIIWLSNYLFPVQWNTVTALTVAWIVRTINFYTHFSKNTNLETDTSLPII